MTQGKLASDQSVRQLKFSDLTGWGTDDYAAAYAVFRSSVDRVEGPDWAALRDCNATVEDPRAFFEHHFVPVLIEDGSDPLFTGYYEPELAGSRRQVGRFQIPLYRMPDALGDPAPTRAQIDAGALAGQNLELVWLDDPLDAFLLQVQGSGRIRLDDGGMMRVGYAGRNGYDYSSIGAELLRRGVGTPGHMTPEVIRAYVAQDRIGAGN